MIQINYKNCLKATILTGCLLFVIPNANAQEPEAPHEEFKKWRLGFGIGQTFLPAGQHESEQVKMLVLPTIGLDLQYWFNPKFGLALKNELEIQSYVIENEYYSELAREYPFSIVLVAMYKLNNGLSFYLGPGIEIEHNKNFFIVKGGMEYDLKLGNHWDVIPELYYFNKDGKIGGFGVAVTFGKRF